MSAIQVEQGPAVAPIELGSAAFDPRGKGQFPLGMLINVRGAALESVTLNQFRQDLKSDKPYVFQEPYASSSAYAAALATRSINVNGMEVALSGLNWRCAEHAADHAIFTVDIPDGAGGKLTVEKRYDLKRRTDQTSGYEIGLIYTLANSSSNDVNVKLAFNGVNAPDVGNNRYDIAQVASAVDTGDAQAHVVELKNHDPISGFKDKNPVDLKAGSAPFLWAGVRTNYFDAFVRTVDNGGKAVLMDKVEAFALNPEEKDDPAKKYVVTSFVTRAGELKVPAGGSLVVPLAVYLGPASREILDSSYYAQYPRRYNQTLVISSGPCSFCTLPWLINGLVMLLGLFHVVLRDWGLSIITLVILVRGILHPITKRSQISMMKMGKMGPEMERLKKKYGDNKEELNKAMMEFYKTQGMSPFLGCLPMFLQMPIWIALYSSLQTTFELRHSPFLWGFTWIKDLSQPDELFRFHQGINLGFFTLDALNLLPLLMAGVSFFQSKYMQAQPTATMTPEQKQQQNMMKWMSVIIFPLMFYKGPAGLNLYIITSSVLGIVEGKIIREHIRKREEAEKAGKIIVDAPVTRMGKKLRHEQQDQQKKHQPATGIKGLWARLQAKADRAMSDARKQQKK